MHHFFRNIRNYTLSLRGAKRSKCCGNLVEFARLDEIASSMLIESLFRIAYSSQRQIFILLRGSRA